jgi:UDP-N-acetylmuramate--alanine ligase
MSTGFVSGLPRSIHFTGIGGAGMSGLAEVLHDAGHEVTGSDREKTPLVKKLMERGIPIRLTQGTLPESPDLLVRTAAIPESHPEIQAAVQRKIPVLRRAVLLGKLLECPVSVAIAGTHGKTSTTAMLAKLLSQLVPDAGWFVGGQLKHFPSSKLGAGDVRICEADEFDRSFLDLSPTHLLLGPVDWDHVDCYPTTTDLHQAFDQLADNLRGDAPIIRQLGTSALDAKIYVPQCVKTGRREITVGDDSQADLRVIPRAGQGNCFDLVSKIPLPSTGRRFVQSFRLGIPGGHNRLNAATAVAWLLFGEWGYDISPAEASKALQDFAGLERRFQLIHTSGNRRFYDDYAHHPSEIAAFIRGLRELGDGPITVLHQPHTYTRVQAFAKETGEALSLADRVLLWPIFPAREQAIPGIDHACILPWIKDCEAHLMHSEADLRALLSDNFARNELFATVGAGDLYKQHALLKELISR